MHEPLPTLEAIAQAHRDVPGGLLPALHAVQDALGHVPDAAVPVLAQALNRSRAEVHGVLSYYTHFRRHAPGRCVLQLCVAEACQSMGGQALVEHAEARLGCRVGDTRADGAVTLEAVHCLGLCATAPALQLDERLHARVDPTRLDRLLDGVEALRG